MKPLIFVWQDYQCSILCYGYINVSEVLHSADISYRVVIVVVVVVVVVVMAVKMVKILYFQKKK